MHPLHINFAMQNGAAVCLIHAFSYAVREGKTEGHVGYRVPHVWGVHGGGLAGRPGTAVQPGALAPQPDHAQGTSSTRRL